MARKTVRVSDLSGEEIPDGRGATVRITFADARRGSRELDLTDAEAEKLGGRQVARRGRRPKSASSRVWQPPANGYVLLRGRASPQIEEEHVNSRTKR